LAKSTPKPIKEKAEESVNSQTALHTKVTGKMTHTMKKEGFWTSNPVRKLSTRENGKTKVKLSMDC